MHSNLRGQIKSLTANKKSQSKKERLVLASEILDMDNQYALTQTPELYNKRLELQTKFDLLTTHQTQNLLLKSKSTFYEHGEKTGKLLANQLKGRWAKQHITNIRTESGDVPLDPIKINTIVHLKIFTPNYTLPNLMVMKC